MEPTADEGIDVKSGRRPEAAVADRDADAKRPVGEPSSRTELTDPRALRAYAHPTRLKLVGLLRTEGPFTATRAAVLTGESVASCSYHLRMLAKYGLVEQAGGGRGREKPWRATAAYTTWPDHPEGAEARAAATALNVTVAELYFERMTRALERRSDLPEEWRDAEEFGDSVLYLTASELREIRDRFREVLHAYDARTVDPKLRPAGARRVEILRIGHLSEIGTEETEETEEEEGRE